MLALLRSRKIYNIMLTFINKIVKKALLWDIMGYSYRKTL
jgi:hypothetical protein